MVANTWLTQYDVTDCDDINILWKLYATQVISSVTHPIYELFPVFSSVTELLLVCKFLANRF